MVRRFNKKRFLELAVKRALETITAEEAEELEELLILRRERY